ncbi:MAG TPA: BTAD domain-containing putative transcriptional regulator [Gaiellaceae bacterium]|nr:BTAD domain-containing putative transcriptional regulator [Gaiellaceae bacterium]
MEFRILGPLEVRESGRAIEVGSTKPRALLAILLLNANRVVSTDALIAALWGERPPGTASKALQVYVSQLRKALGRDRIVTRSPGYELRVEAGELDLHLFEQRVAEGKYSEALALVRGSPLSEFAYEPFAQSEIARIGELELGCLEERIEVDLAHGRHAAIVGELEALVREHPLRERLRGQLMIALYRSGRQADALEAYQAGRAYLSDELGLEPGAALKELQRSILSQDPTLDPTLDPPLPPARLDSMPAVEEATSAPRVREARKTVSVLFCDLTASGRELDPESLRHIAERGFEAVVPVLSAHGATVERSIDGAVSALFGVPTLHEDDALRAVRAAVGIGECLAELRPELEDAWGATLDPRIGIGTGEVLASGESDGDRRLVTGPPVQVAIRLQQIAKAGEILVDERTLRVVGASVGAEPHGDHARVLDVRPVEHGRHARFDSPMVGRERERRRLRDAFEQAVGDRSCQLFTILGAPGVGKSRLVREFVRSVADDALVARGRCLPYGEGITYWPLVEAIRDAGQLDDVSSTADGVAKLVRLLGEADDAESTAQRLGEILGLTDRLSSTEEIVSAVRRFVESLAQKHPLVLVFDDIHWGEATFHDLVDHVADWVTDAPVLLVCIARPELLEIRPGWGGGKLNSTTVLLEPLSDAESAALLDGLQGSTDLDARSRRRIVDAASGNPLFVEEMLALVLEDGRDRNAIDVPPTIQALLAARLDRLPEAERSAIEAAAVEGKVFHASSVVALTASEPEATQAALLGLTRRDLVRVDKPVFSGEQGYSFRHILIRDAAYESIPKAARASLHERHAAWLDERVGDRTLELDEIVGYHYEQAFTYRDELGPLDEHARALGRLGAERLGAAGRRAFMRSDGPAGVNLISRSVALLSPDDPLRVDLIPNVRVIQGLPDLSWADRVLTEAVEAAATSGDRALAAHALVQRGFLRLFVDEDVTPRELFEVAERAIAVFDHLGDELGLARAWRLVAQAHYLNREGGKCADASERALFHVRQARDRFEEREIVEWLVIALLLGPAHAGTAYERCRELLAVSWDDPLVQVEITSAAAALAAMLSRRGEADDLIRSARSAMQEAGEWIWIVSFWYSSIEVWHGNPVAAEAELRPAYEALKKIGEKSHFSSMAHALAAAVYAQGRLDEAEAFTRECEAACRANDVHSHVLWRSIRAKVFARHGRVDEADRLAREAVAFAQTSDFLQAHADALADLAEVHEVSGNRTAAHFALEEALRLHEQKGNGLAADFCRARLAALPAY